MKKLKIEWEKGYRHNKITFSITAHLYTFSIIRLSLLTIFDKWTKQNLYANDIQDINDA